MNAAERATSPEAATKIAAVVDLFKRQFPTVKANLNPWANDPDTQEWVDPDSIDIGFNLPAGQTLVQLRFHEHRLIGIEAACFGPLGHQRWRLSTVGDWTFAGTYPPPSGFQTTLKHVCKELFLLFNGSAPE
ncbi:MAG: hypothetical protein WCD18_27195, partial [Thermosynechococcaceae cyanobacterium]